MRAGVSYAADLRVEGHAGKGLPHFAVDFRTGATRRYSKPTMAARLEASDLTAKLGADGARRAGDHDYLMPVILRRMAASSRLTGLRPRKVLNGHVANLGGETSRFDDFGEARE